jgi:hypothetical protein
VNFTDPSGLLIWDGFPDDVIRTYTVSHSDFPWDFFFRSFFGNRTSQPLRGEPREPDTGRGGRTLPQNPEVPLTSDQTTAVRNGIGGLLTDKCAKFIDNLVSGVTGAAYDSKKSLLTDFDEIRDGGGFFLGGTRHSGSASLSLRKVNINSNNPSNIAGDAFGFLHEIIHIVAQANDQALSEGVKKLGIKVIGYPGYTVSYPTDPDNRNLAYSKYWGQALKNACTPKGY